MFPKGVSLLQLIPSESCAAASCPWEAGGEEGKLLLIFLCLSLSHWQSSPVSCSPRVFPVPSDPVLLLCCTSNPFHLSHILCSWCLSTYPSLRSFLLSSSPYSRFAFCPFELPFRSRCPQRGGPVYAAVWRDAGKSRQETRPGSRSHVLRPSCRHLSMP